MLVKRNLYALVLWGLMLGSCNVVDYSPLSRERAERNVQDLDEKLGARISQLDESIKEIRQMLVFAVMSRQLDAEVANKVQAELMVADYFMARSWASLVEKQSRTSELLDEGNQAFKRAIALVAKAAEANRERRSF